MKDYINKILFTHLNRKIERGIMEFINKDQLDVLEDKNFKDGKYEPVDITK